MVRHPDFDLHEQIPELILLAIDRHPESQEPELCTVRRFFRDIDLDRAFECFHLCLSPEHSGIQFNGGVPVEIVSHPVKYRMGRNPDGEIEVAVWTAAPSGTPFACNPQYLHVRNARFDRHSDGLAMELDKPGRAVIRLFK